LIAELKPFVEDDTQTEMLIFKDAAVEAWSKLVYLQTQEMHDDDEAALALIEQRICAVADSLVRLQPDHAAGENHITTSVGKAHRIDCKKELRCTTDQNNEYSNYFRQRFTTRIPDTILKSKRMAAYFQNQGLAAPENYKDGSVCSQDAMNRIPTIIAPTPASSPIISQSNPSFFLTRPDTPTTRSHYRTSSTWNGTIGLRRTVSSIITPGFNIETSQNAEICPDENITERLHPFHAKKISNSNHELDKAEPYLNSAVATSGLSRRISFENIAPGIRLASNLSASEYLKYHASVDVRGIDTTLKDIWGSITPKRRGGNPGFHDRTGSSSDVIDDAEGMMFPSPSQAFTPTSSLYARPEPSKEKPNKLS
jgi:hypothetical protein